MELSTEIQDQFEEIDDRIEAFYEEGNHEKIIECELEKWNLLPEEKINYDESFFIARSLTDEYLEIKDYNSSQKWSEVLMNCDKERIDDGEREFVSGKVYFELQDFKESMEFFKTAFLKSKGRAFSDENPKYLDFYKNPEKYQKK